VLLLPVAVGAYAGAVPEAALVLLRQRPWNWAEVAVRAFIPAVTWGIIYALENVGRFPTRYGRRRVQGSPDTRTAIRTGILPPDADPDRWHPWLELERREQNQLRWLTLVLWVAGGALVAIAGAVVNDEVWGVWALAAALVAFGVFAFGWATNRMTSADRLIDELLRR
jgi:hypothetical protein